MAVLSAVYHILNQDPLQADYIGIETKLRSSHGTDITPDLVAMYNSRSRGIVFELKYSLPFSKALLEKEVKELKKYIEPCSQWKNSTGKVEFHDFIFICNVEDAERLLTTILEVAKEQGFGFLTSEGFSVWTWTISAARGGERREHLILSNVYGKTRNTAIENMINKPTGLILPEESLTYLRSSFSFTREKPPVQYTIISLAQHVLSQFLDLERGTGVYEITTDMIYDKSKILFPSWRDYDVQTLQVKRRWITQALEVMFALNMIGKPVGKPESWRIPIPVFKTREPIELALCKKLSKHKLKVTRRRKPRGRPRIKSIRMEPHPKIKKISDYF